MGRHADGTHAPGWNGIRHLDGKWSLYRDLIAGIPEDVRVRRFVIGQYLAYVEAESGLGVSMVVRGGSGNTTLDVVASGMSLRDLAARAVSWNFLDATVGVAALNAWYAGQGAAKANGVVWDGGDNDGFRAYRNLVAGKRVCVVGHFPLIERMGDICDLIVLERMPQPGDIPDSACEYVIGGQDLLFSTGITLQNKTLPRLLELAREGGVRVILVGPSAVPAPVLFGYGVDCVAGSMAMPEDANGIKRAIEQGCRTGAFGGGLRKTRLERPGWNGGF